MGDSPALDRLAAFVANAPLQPGEQWVESVRLALVDTVGCVLAGAQEPAAAAAQRTVAMWGGSGQSPVFGTGQRVAPPWAALVNGTASHAIEFDDWESPGNTHPSGVLFPAILSVAAHQTLRGPDVASAYVAGFEVITRLGKAMNFEHYASGWHATGTLGAVGAAAAVANLRRLDVDQTANALSIATSQMGGFTSQLGSDAKSLHAGFAAMAGVMAASLAEAGMTGQSHVLERSVLPLMGPDDAGRLDDALAGLGETLGIDEHGIVIKPYPTCGYSHRVIDCARELHQRGIDPSRIRAVRTSLVDFHAAIVPYRMPSDRHQAMFSAPFAIAAALVDGTVDRTHLRDAAWMRPEIARVISATTVEERPPLDPKVNLDAADPDWVEVTLHDGSTERAECSFPLGTPQRPLSRSAVVDKFAGNAPWLQPDAASELLGWIESDDVSVLLKPMEPSP